MSVYEYSSFIIARSLQLKSINPETNKPLVDIQKVGSYDPLVIATYEINNRLPNLVLRRHLINGEIEDWHLKELSFPRI